VARLGLQASQPAGGRLQRLSLACGRPATAARSGLACWRPKLAWLPWLILWFLMAVRVSTLTSCSPSSCRRSRRCLYAATNSVCRIPPSSSWCRDTIPAPVRWSWTSRRSVRGGEPQGAGAPCAASYAWPAVDDRGAAGSESTGQQGC
jgi:hypothetical protein